MEVLFVISKRERGTRKRSGICCIYLILSSFRVSRVYIVCSLIKLSRSLKQKFSLFVKCGSMLCVRIYVFSFILFGECHVVFIFAASFCTTEMIKVINNNVAAAALKFHKKAHKNIERDQATSTRITNILNLNACIVY